MGGDEGAGVRGDGHVAAGAAAERSAAEANQADARVAAVAGEAADRLGVDAGRVGAEGLDIVVQFHRQIASDAGGAAVAARADEAEAGAAALAAAAAEGPRLDAKSALAVCGDLAIVLDIHVAAAAAAGAVPALRTDAGHHIAAAAAGPAGRKREQTDRVTAIGRDLGVVRQADGAAIAAAAAVAALAIGRDEGVAAAAAIAAIADHRDAGHAASRCDVPRRDAHGRAAAAAAAAAAGAEAVDREERNDDDVGNAAVPAGAVIDDVDARGIRGRGHGLADGAGAANGGMGGLLLGGGAELGGDAGLLLGRCAGVPVVEFGGLRGGGRAGVHRVLVGLDGVDIRRAAGPGAGGLGGFTEWRHHGDCGHDRRDPRQTEPGAHGAQAVQNGRKDPRGVDRHIGNPPRPKQHRRQPRLSAPRPPIRDCEIARCAKN